jgi:hypothetical protein
MNQLSHAFQKEDGRRPASWGRRVLVGAVWLGFGTCGLPSSAVAQDVVLRTLLYTPAQRLAIGQARQSPPGAAGTAGTAGTTSRPSTMRLDGVVARPRGRGTAWVNGEAVAQGASPSTVIRGTEAVVEGHRLRVGESFDTGTGVKSDVVAPGAVRRRVSP